MPRESSRIASKREAADEPTTSQSPTPPPPKKKKKTGSEATRDWLQRMQHNSPERYSDDKEKNREMCKAYRGNATEEQKVKQREQAKERMRKMRQLKKEKQFDRMKKQIPAFRSTVGMVLDFAENFTCTNQDEVQSARWYYEQVTVHPIVTYFPCSSCDQTVSESLVFISDDRTHDYNAVFRFTQIAMQHLRGTRRIDPHHVMQWTDGCGSQYKSKGPFADISHALADFGCTWERNFFGSRHGKGPSDGESAVVKHHASSAVKARTATIFSARDLFEYCQGSKLNKQPEEDCQHFLRTFFYVPSEDIVRQRGRAVKTVKGTRSLHSVRSVEPNKLLTRELSCACHHCWSSTGVCSIAAVTGEWKTQFLNVEDCPLPAPASPLSAPASPLPAPTSPLPVPTSPLPTPDGPLPATGSPLLAPESPSSAPGSPSSAPGIPLTGPNIPTLAVAPPPSTNPAPVAECTATASPSSNPGPSTSTSLPEVESFITAIVPGHKRTVPFYAKVMEVDQETKELRIQFLEKRSYDSQAYVLTKEAWIAPRDVLSRVNKPAFAPRRGLAFIFDH